MIEVLKEKNRILDDINKRISLIEEFSEKLKLLEVENKNLKDKIEVLKKSNLNIEYNQEYTINELIEKMDTKLTVEEIETSLMHVSYIKDKALAASNKIKISIGGSIIDLIARLYFLFESNKSINEITSIISLENIIEAFYDDYNLEKYIKVSNGEKENGIIKYTDQVKIIIYNIYVKEGYKKVYKLLEKYIKSGTSKDYKSLLQIYTQKYNEFPKYEVIEVEKRPETIFTVKVKALNKFAIARDKSKKIAEKKAAEKYFIENNINLEEKKTAVLGDIRNKKSWNLSLDRKIAVKNVINKMNIPKDILKENIADAALTHISYRDSAGKNNRELSFIGAYILNVEVQRVLFNSMDLNNESAKEFGSKSSDILLESNISEKVLKKYNNIFLKNMLFSGSLSGDILAYSGFKSIIGALLYCDFINEYNNEVEIQDVIYTLIKKMDFDETNSSYINWIIDFNQGMDIDIEELHLNKVRDKNNVMFSNVSRLNLAAYNLDSIVVKSEGKSKVEIRGKIASKFFDELKSRYDITNKLSNIPNEENYNLFLGNLINYVLKETSFYNTKLEMVGGLLIDKWCNLRATNIIKSLNERGLYYQLNKILKLWINKYDVDIIEKIDCVKNIPFVDYLIKTYRVSKNINNDNCEDEIKEIDIEGNSLYLKKYLNSEVKVKLYNFKSNICPFCGNKLVEGNKNIFVIRKNMLKGFVINTGVLNCEICNISGLGYSQIQQINSLGFYHMSYYNTPSIQKFSTTYLKNIEVYLMKSPMESVDEMNYSIRYAFERKKIINKIHKEAMEFVYEHENKVLNYLNKEGLIEKVKKVIETNYRIGYDILSFNEEGEEKYIKVVSSTGYVEEFNLKDYEIEAMKKYGEKYYIYKVNNIRTLPYIRKIKNPAILLESGKMRMKAKEYKVNL